MIGNYKQPKEGVSNFFLVVAVIGALVFGMVFGFVSASVQFRQTYNYTWYQDDQPDDSINLGLGIDNSSGFEYPDYQPRKNNKDVVFVNVFNYSMCPVTPTLNNESMGVYGFTKQVDNLIYDLGRIKPKGCNIPACSFGFSLCKKQVDEITQGIRQTDK